MHVADDVASRAYLEWAASDDFEIQASDRKGDVETAVAALEAAEAELVAYRDANLVSVIGGDAYRAGLLERAARVDAAREELGRVHADRAVPFGHFDIASMWPDLSIPERRLLIESAIDRVVVSGSTPGLPAADRLRVVFRDDREDEMREAGT